MKTLFVLMNLFFLTGCITKPLPVISGYQPLAKISDSGFLNDNDNYKKYNKKVVTVWGYLDIANSSLDGLVVREKLFFNLKSRYENKTGESVRVVCLGDQKRYKNIFMHLAKIGEFGKEKIFVKGKLLLHHCPTNFTMNYCVMIAVNDPADIRFSADSLR